MKYLAGIYSDPIRRDSTDGPCEQAAVVCSAVVESPGLALQHSRAQVRAIRTSKVWQRLDARWKRLCHEDGPVSVGARALIAKTRAEERHLKAVANLVELEREVRRARRRF